MFSPVSVETESVAQMMIRRLEQCGITKIFGVPGGACSALDDAALQSKIEVVTCAHESIAGYMAIGYHLETALPGVVIVTSGPGVLNVSTAIAAAKTDEAGLLVLAGDVARPNACRGALQDGGHAGLDILHAMRPLAGLALTIDRPEQAAIRLEKALHRCTQGPKGPAFVQIPIDIQTATIRPTDVYLPGQRNGQPPLPSTGPAAALLKDAKNPVIFAGLGVRRANASDALRRLAEHAAIPVLCDAEGLGVLCPDHPLLIGTYGIGDRGAGSTWLSRRDTDVILIVGARLDDTTTNGFSADLGNPRIIQLDYDQHRLARAYAVEVALSGDLNATLGEIQAGVPKATFARNRRVVELVHDVREKEELEDEKMASAIDWGRQPPSGLDPREIAHTLNEIFGEQTTFVSDIGNHLLAMLRHHRVAHPDRFHFSMGLGAMGSGIGMAMGLAAGGRDNVVLICGDGGALMCGNDIATCVKYGINLVMLVFNDGHLGMVQHGYTKVYGQSDPFSLPTFSVAPWAQSLGAQTIRAHSLHTLKGARDWRGPGPLVVEIKIDNKVTFPNSREALIQFSGEQTPDLEIKE